jgi:hypothetical protein
MTHILIPIKDIEEEIKTLQSSRQKKISKGFLNDAQAIQNQILVYKEILLGKQISLNEENIEEKATKYSSNIKEYLKLDELIGRKRGYKQALKDLI